MTNPRFLLDSKACIYLLGGLSDTLRTRVEACSPEEIVTSAIVYAEVMRGIDGEAASGRRKAKRLFEIVAVLPFDIAAAATYAGVPFRRGQFDRLIAAHALALGLIVVTSNSSEFSDVPDLKVEDWTQ